VTYDADPREDPGALAHPVAVLVAGRLRATDAGGSEE
jgi:hypothetical protein